MQTIKIYASGIETLNKKASELTEALEKARQLIDEINKTNVEIKIRSNQE